MRVIVLLFGIFLWTSVSCSHFRGATFSWEPIANGSIQVNFRVSWSMSYAFCNQTIIDSGTKIVDNSERMMCFAGCRGNIGDLSFYCTDYSIEDQWSSGKNSIVFTMPENLTSRIGYAGGNWIRDVGNGAWSLAMTINSTIRRDTGQVNHSPTVDMPPVLRVQSNCTYIIKLPVFDVDGDTVRCRWARAYSECASVCNKFPNATINETTCTIEYTPHWKDSTYVMTVQIEDFASKDSVKPLSSVPLQVMVIIQNIGACDQVPEFICPTPDEDACIPVKVRKPFVITLKARSHTKLKSITTSSPVGMTRSVAVFSHVRTWYYITVNITWVPSMVDAGTDRSLCFYATDESRVSSPLRCLRLPVPGSQKRRANCGTEVACDLLDQPAGGEVRYSNTSHGSVASYTCHAGQVLQGTSDRKCEAGIWSGEDPVCLADTNGSPRKLMVMCVIACFLVATLLVVLISIVSLALLRRPPAGQDKGTSTTDLWTNCWDEQYNNDVQDDANDTTSLFKKQSTKGSNKLSMIIHRSREIVPSPEHITDLKQTMDKQIFSITEVP